MDRQPQGSECRVGTDAYGRPLIDSGGDAYCIRHNHWIVRRVSPFVRRAQAGALPTKVLA